MVWWIDNNESIEGEHRIYDQFDIEEDRIFQSINVLFNFTEKIADAYEINSLLKAGVHIFNIDRTVKDDSTYRVIKKAINDCKKLPQMTQASYIRPVCLSVTMSINNPITIDEDIDVIILKNVINEKSVAEFKEFSISLLTPVLLWFNNCYNEDVIDLIRISDGIILDYTAVCEKKCHEIIQYCKQYRKPVFCLKPEVYEDFRESNGGRRKLFVVASGIVKDGIHGVIVNETKLSIMEQANVIQNVVKALRIAENQLKPEVEFNNLRKQISIPQLVPMTVAIAATSLAITSGASAIILMTSSGNTARLVSCSSPSCHIIAVTRYERVLRQMHLYKKVLPVLYKKARAESWHEECRKRVLFGTDFAVRAGLVDGGAKLVVLAPTEEGTGYCDGFQIVAMPFKCDE